MSTAHTPGPWIIETDENGLATITDSATEGIEIAKIRTHSIRIGIKLPDLREEKTANARLIATAPEMLAALEQADRELSELLASRKLDSTDAPFHAVRRVRDQVRAAIAKATR